MSGTRRSIATSVSRVVRAVMAVSAASAASLTSPVLSGEPAPWFVDVTERAGIDFVHACGSVQKDWITEVNGSGLALFDMDGDGDDDIFFVNGAPADQSGKVVTHRLFRNDGAWCFTDVTARAGVEIAAHGCGAAVADVENDGDLDLYVTQRGPNALLLNDGDGSFRLARESGSEHPGWSVGCAFADLDRDGLVDLYVANYLRFEEDPARRRGSLSCEYKGEPIFCGPGGYEPEADAVFLNEGQGRFRDVSEEWGLGRVRSAFGLGALAIDADGDEFPDILVANDTHPNHLLRNRKGSGFEESALFFGLAYNDYGVAQAGMGIAAGDLRRSGHEDIFVTNFEDDTNTLYVNRGEGAYAEDTYPSALGGASYRYLGWGTMFLDADNDADLDVFVANGHVAPQADRMPSSPGYRQRNQLFVGDGSGRFREAVARGDGLAVVESSRGAASSDLDGDGDLDIVVSNIDTRPTVLENRLPRGARSISVRLLGTRSNRAAIGARVTVRAGDVSQSRTVRGGTSFASQCTLRAHFGLGDLAGPVTVRVAWPSGGQEEFRLDESSAMVDLQEGDGESATGR